MSPHPCLPVLRRTEELEGERAGFEDRLNRLDEDARQAKALAAVKESDVRRMLDALAEDMASLDREHLKDFLRSMIERLTLDPSPAPVKPSTGYKVELSWRPQGDSSLPEKKSIQSIS